MDNEMTETVTPDNAEPRDSAPVDAEVTVDWKAHAREWERRAKANAGAAKRLADIEESQKTETQKLLDAKTAAEKVAEESRLELLRYRIGTAAGLPADAIERLRGADEEELKADAEKLARLFPKSAPPVAGPSRERLRPGSSGTPQDTPNADKIAAAIHAGRYR